MRLSLKFHSSGKAPFQTKYHYSLNIYLLDNWDQTLLCLFSLDFTLKEGTELKIMKIFIPNFGQLDYGVP